jgi:hypothetical protein
MPQTVDPYDPRLLALLEGLRRWHVPAECAKCGRILGKLEALHPEMWAVIDHYSKDQRARPHITRGEFSTESHALTGTLVFHCKCGADIQRNKVRLVPAFVRAANAGTTLKL